MRKDLHLFVRELPCEIDGVSRTTLETATELEKVSNVFGKHAWQARPKLLEFVVRHGREERQLDQLTVLVEPLGSHCPLQDFDRRFHRSLPNVPGLSCAG